MTYSWKLSGGVDDVVKAAVNNVSTVVQRWFKHNLRLFHAHSDQHHWPLDVVEVVKLGRVITEVVATLHTTLEIVKVGQVIAKVIATLHTTLEVIRVCRVVTEVIATIHTTLEVVKLGRVITRIVAPYTQHWRSSKWVGSSPKSLLPYIEKTYVSKHT